MSSYPSIRIDPDDAEDEQTQDGEVFIDGAGKGKVYWPASAKRFKFTHHAVDQATAETVVGFWEANKTIPFDFVWPVDRVTYSVQFIKRPRVKAVGKDSPSLRNVMVELVEA